MACDGQCTAHLDGRIDDDGNECHLGQNMFCAQVLDGVPCNPRRSGPLNLPRYKSVEYFTMRNPSAGARYQACGDLGLGYEETAAANVDFVPYFEFDDEQMICYNRAVYGVDQVVCPDGWSFSSRINPEFSMQMRMACPNQLVNSVVCTPDIQTYSCYGRTCGGFYADAPSCNGFTCESTDEVCAAYGRDVDITCETGTQCSASSGTGDDHTIMKCKSGSTCTGSAGTGDARTTMNCAAGSTCSCQASTGRAQCIMNCEEGATCSCERKAANSACVWN